MKEFLPTTQQEIKSLGWKQVDIILITGDAYIDHPSFGTALIGRSLQAAGYKVAILPQPDWCKNRDFLSLGLPRLYFGISAGNMDSMVNHYTASRKKRSSDAYSPNAASGLRPDRASIIYSQKVRSLFKKTPIILGGIEASLRRIPHYDYWSNKIRNSILFDARADLIVYGMGEKAAIEIADRLNKNKNMANLENIPGTVVSVQEIDREESIFLPEFRTDFSTQDYRKMVLTFNKYQSTRTIYQRFSQRYLKHNKPSSPLTEKEIDKIYELPFTRKPHPRYKNQRITAFEQIKNSITSHRGCFGGCNFCALSVHQGREIQSRSIHSIKKEIKKFSSNPEFKGTISDIGGPTANMYGLVCKLEDQSNCKRSSCLYPEICSNLNLSQTGQINLLREVAQIENIKNVFVASGIRHDLALRDLAYVSELIKNHTGGLLKLAPEHKSGKVLKLMNKPDFRLYQDFVKLFRKISHSSAKKQYIVPYIMVGHPGETLQETLELALYLRKNNIRLTQVQEFTPTPMTLSTMMYYTALDLKGDSIHIPGEREKKLQKALVQWFMPRNKKYVIEALRKLDRKDLFNLFLGKTA